MEEQKFWLAIDTGGTAIKVGLYDQAGKECCVKGITIEPSKPNPGWMERCLETMWQQCLELMKEIVAESELPSSSVKAITMTGYGNGLALIDAEGNPVRPGILSSDTRAAKIVDTWRKKGFDDTHQTLTHQPMWAGKPLPLVAWLKDNEPENLSKAKYIVMVKDYVRAQLTGVIEQEISDASSASLVETESRQYAIRMFESLGMYELTDKLPPLIDTLSVAGKLREDVAKYIGLASGTPVTAGYADGPAMMVGQGVSGEQSVGVIAGTWGLNQMYSSKSVTDGSILATLLSYEEGKYVLVDGSANSGSVMQWVVDAIIKRCLSIEKGGKSVVTDSDIYQWIEHAVKEVKSEPSDLFFLPHLNGRIDASGMFANFLGTKSWHDVRHMILAVMEGVAFEHRYHVENLCTKNKKPKIVRFGGGVSRSNEWVKVFANVLATPIELCEVEETGALGCAILAAVCLGEHTTVEKAIKAMSGVRDCVEPEKEQACYLNRKYKKYLTLRSKMKN